MFSPTRITTTNIGKLAEDTVSRYLQKQGYEILNRNWKTRTCEIDLVAFKQKTIYFIEVKYRSSGKQGNGFAYITPQKQRQMRYAAALWVAKNNWQGLYCLSSASVGGPKFETEFIENIV